MGHKLSWLLIEDVPLSKLCELLGMDDTGLASNVVKSAGRNHSDVQAMILPSGFGLVVCHDIFKAGKIFRAEERERISKSYPTIYGSLYENVGRSTAESWVNGQQVWKVEHDACLYGPNHLEYTGALPAIFEDVKRELLAEQVEEDKLEEDGIDCIFEIPIELVDRMTGYRYTHYLPERLFHSLVPKSSEATE